MSYHLVQELGLLDKNNNPLTHAKYHQDKVREAGERDRRPLPLVVPSYLEDQIREYLTQVSLHMLRERTQVFPRCICVHSMPKVCGRILVSTFVVGLCHCHVKTNISICLTVPSCNRSTEPLGGGRGKRTADNKPGA